MDSKFLVGLVTFLVTLCVLVIPILIRVRRGQDQVEAIDAVLGKVQNVINRIWEDFVRAFQIIDRGFYYLGWILGGAFALALILAGVSYLFD